MLGSYHFVYNGKNSAEFNVIVCEIGGSSSVNTVDLGVKRTIVEDAVSGRRTPLFYGVQRKNKLSMNFTIAKCDSDDAFTIEETRRLARWLMGSKTYQWFQLCDFDMSSLDYKDIYYRLLFTDMRPVTVGGDTVGFTLYAECDSPFAWSEEKVYICKSLEDSETTYLLINDSDDCDYIYPNMEITCYAPTDISIVNESEDGREFLWKSAPESNAPISIDGKNGICKLTDGLLLDNYNFNFFRLVPGENIVTMRGSFKLRLTFREPVIVSYE